MTVWRYFGIVDPVTESASRPGGLLRQAEGAPKHEAQVLGRSGEWVTSDLPYRIWLGKEYDELHAMTRAEAAASARASHTRGILQNIPDDLVDP